MERDAREKAGRSGILARPEQLPARLDFGLRPELGPEQATPARFQYGVSTDLTRLGLSLDELSFLPLQLLLNEEGEETLSLATDHLGLNQVLDQLVVLTKLATLTIAGGLDTVTSLASGNFQRSQAGLINGEFVAKVAQRRNLDSLIIQNLREISTAKDLIQLLSRRHLGWLMDEMCGLACLELRKYLSRPLRLEVLVFGFTGAVLGRALTEPAYFRL